MRAAGYVNESLGSDEAAAIRKAKELNERWDADRTALPPDPLRDVEAGSVTWLIERFRRDPVWYEARAPRTREQMDWAFRQIEPLFGKVRVRDIQRKHLRAYYNDVRLKGSATKAEKVMKWFARLLAYAVENGVVENNLAARMNIESPQHRTTVWTPSEIEAVINCALSPGVAPSGNKIPARPGIALAVSIAYDTSLPLQDVLALTWKQYDPASGDLKVTQMKNRGNRKLILPLSNRTRAMMERIERGSVQMIVNEETNQPYPDLFSFSKVFRKVKSRAGLTRQLTFHDIRRTVLTELGAKGATNAELSAIGGHSPASPMLRVYVQPTREAAVSAIRKRGIRDD